MGEYCGVSVAAIRMMTCYCKRRNQGKVAMAVVEDEVGRVGGGTHTRERAGRERDNMWVHIFCFMIRVF
ncbi:hypothetical protein Hanom_Chr13g01187511 [Helianthus anomalus]